MRRACRGRLLVNQIMPPFYRGLRPPLWRTVLWLAVLLLHLDLFSMADLR